MGGVFPLAYLSNGVVNVSCQVDSKVCTHTVWFWEKVYKVAATGNVCPQLRQGTSSSRGGGLCEDIRWSPIR